MRCALTIIILISIILSGCARTEDTNNCPDGVTCNAISDNVTNAQATTVSPDIMKIEVIHFHGTNQCYSCKTVGAYAEKTINIYYRDLIESGKMSFAHINVELAENSELTMKYGPTGSSLWIGIYYADGQFRKEENVNVWYKIRNEADYLSYLKGVLDKRLAGDLS